MIFLLRCSELLAFSQLPNLNILDIIPYNDSHAHSTCRFYIITVPSVQKCHLFNFPMTDVSLVLEMPFTTDGGKKFSNSKKLSDLGVWTQSIQDTVPVNFLSLSFSISLSDTHIQHTPHLPRRDYSLGRNPWLHREQPSTLTGMYGSLWSLPFSPHLSVDVAEMWGPSLPSGPHIPFYIPSWSQRSTSRSRRLPAFPLKGRLESLWQRRNSLQAKILIWLIAEEACHRLAETHQPLLLLSISTEQTFFSPVGSLLPPQEARLMSSLLCRTPQTYPGFLLRQAFVNVPKCKSIMALTLVMFTLLILCHQRTIDLYHLFGRKTDFITPWTGHVY